MRMSRIYFLSAQKDKVKLKVVVVLLSLLVAWPVMADEIDEYEKFLLWNDCQPVSLNVMVDIEGLEGSGSTRRKRQDLARERIQTTVESRLRRARIYTDDYSSHGSVAASITGYSGDSIIPDSVFFSIEIQLFLPVDRPKIGLEQFYIATWQTDWFGIGDSGDVLEIVAEKTDQFINEYLRVNAKACK